LKHLLAVQRLKSRSNPSIEGSTEAAMPDKALSDGELILPLVPSENPKNGLTNEYVQLQLRIFRMTLVLTVFAVLISAIFVDFQASISLFIGSLSGLLYLRLLARGIGKLGSTTMSVSKFQLLVPILLFFVVSRQPELELWPALLGFLLYKPSLIIQFLLEP